jgi:hypothetical protein
LSYEDPLIEPGYNNQTRRISGSSEIKLTEMILEAEIECDAVTVALALQYSSEQDRTVTARLRDGAIKHAIQNKQKAFQRLELLLLVRVRILLEQLQRKYESEKEEIYGEEVKEANWSQYRTSIVHRK